MNKHSRLALTVVCLACASILLAALAVLGAPPKAGDKPKGKQREKDNWMSEYNLEVIKAEGREEDFAIQEISQPGGVYFPAEKVTVTLAVPAGQKDGLAGAVIDIVGINTRGNVTGETGSVTAKETPRIALSNTPAAKAELDSFKPDAKGLTVELPVPDTYGAYALVLQRKDGTRTALGTVARVVRPATAKDAIPQIMGEVNAGPPELVAPLYARLGIRLVRWELGWAGLEKNPGEYDWSRVEGVRDYEKAGIKIMNIMGGHPAWSRPFKEPTPAVSARKPDDVCKPQYDPNYGSYVYNYVKKYWSGGQAGLWGLELWNEPWEPTSISGWSSDSVRYRSLLQQLSTQAKAAGADIKILAACSIMNTEDKLLSQDSNEWIRYVDIFTDHYVIPRNAYGPMVAQRWGKLSGETETWGAAREFLLPQFMTQFLAVGQRFLNPCTGGMLFSNAGTKKAPLLTPHPLVAAVAAWNAIIADRPFRHIAFTDHLPWLYQFGDDSDAAFVLYGKLMPIASGNVRDLVWSQAAGGPDGKLNLADPQGVLEVMDCAGNLIAPKDKAYELPMTTTPYFVRSAKGAAAVIEAVRSGRLGGLRQVEILPAALGVLPAAGKPASLAVNLHNLLNVEVSGELKAESPVANAVAAEPVKVQMKPGQTATALVSILALGQSGALPVKFTFTSPAGSDTWQEIVQPAVISRSSPKMEGDLGDWAKLPGVTVLRPDANGAEGDVIENVWLPYMKQSSDPVPARRGEVKLAWDDNNLYILARVEANDIKPKQRLETWNENQYFHDSNSPLYDERYAEFATKKKIDFKDAPDVYRSAFGGESPYNGDIFQFAFDTDPAGQRFTRTHDLKYPLGLVPEGFCATPDTDYEFSLYSCQGGGTELWCLLAPGIPRNHHLPRSPRAAVDQHAVKSGKCQVLQQDTHTVYTIALPWKELGIEKPAAGMDLGFTFRFGFSSGAKKGGPAVEYGLDLGETKSNGLSMHPYWMSKASCSVRWTLLP